MTNVGGAEWELWLPLALHVDPNGTTRTSEVMSGLLSDERIREDAWNGAPMLVVSGQGR